MPVTASAMTSQTGMAITSPSKWTIPPSIVGMIAGLVVKGAKVGGGALVSSAGVGGPAIAATALAAPPGSAAPDDRWVLYCRLLSNTSGVTMYFYLKGYGSQRRMSRNVNTTAVRIQSLSYMCRTHCASRRSAHARISVRIPRCEATPRRRHRRLSVHHHRRGYHLVSSACSRGSNPHRCGRARGAPLCQVAQRKPLPQLPHLEVAGASLEVFHHGAVDCSCCRDESCIDSRVLRHKGSGTRS